MMPPSALPSMSAVALATASCLVLLHDATTMTHHGLTVVSAFTPQTLDHCISSTTRHKLPACTPCGATNKNGRDYCQHQHASLSLFSPISTNDHPLNTGPTNHDRPTPPIPPKYVTGVTLKLAFDSSPQCWGIADLSATKSERFTSPQSLDMVHRLRAVSDCVLVGRGTVEADDCTLTVRRGAEDILEQMGRKQPTRVVIDPTLKILRDHADDGCPKCYKILDDGLPVIIYHNGAEISQEMETVLSERPDVTVVDGANLEGERSKEGTSASVIVQGGSLQTFSISPTHVHPVNSKTIPPELIIKDLQSRGLKHIMVEGGAATALSFLRAHVVDRAIIVKASVQFQEPLDSGINQDVLEQDGGLIRLGTSVGAGGDEDLFGDDCIEYFSLGGTWPTNALTDWP